MMWQWHQLDHRQIICSRQTTMPTPHHSVFTGRMLFLTSNQQRQSTEGSKGSKVMLCFKLYNFSCSCIFNHAKTVGLSRLKSHNFVCHISRQLNDIWQLYVQMNREHSCKISSKNFKRLLKNLQKMAGDYFFWRTLYKVTAMHVVRIYNMACLI